MAKNEIVKVEKYQALALADDLTEVIEANFGNEGLKPSDLPRVKVPAGGGQMWEVPTLDGPAAMAMLSGIIIHHDRVRAYWPDPDTTGTPPECSSVGCKIGVGKPGGNCATCPLAQFGTAVKGNGQACKETRVLYMLPPDQALPLVVSIPPTSLGAVKKHLVNLASNVLPFWKVVTNLSLEKDRNAEGKDYSKVVFSAGERLDPDQAMAIEAYRNSLIGGLKEASAAMAAGSAAVDL